MLLAFLAAALLTESPDSALDPISIYSKSMDRMRALSLPSFIRYHYTVVLDHHSKKKTYNYTVIERLQDHYGRFISLNADGTESQDIHLHRTLISPAFFLRPEEPGANGGGLKNIGEIVASPYEIVLGAIEPAGSCASAYRLELSPKGDPDRFSLRQLWIDSETYRICRATVLKRIYIIAREPALVDLDVDARGFVDRWHLSGSGHFVFMSYSIDATGVFTDVTGLSDADPKLFQ
jgi:hypothetical protein